MIWVKSGERGISGCATPHNSRWVSARIRLIWAFLCRWARTRRHASGCCARPTKAWINWHNTSSSVLRRCRRLPVPVKVRFQPKNPRLLPRRRNSQRPVLPQRHHYHQVKRLRKELPLFHLPHPFHPRHLHHHLPRTFRFQPRLPANRRAFRPLLRPRRAGHRRSQQNQSQPFPPGLHHLPRKNRLRYRQHARI